MKEYKSANGFAAEYLFWDRKLGQNIAAAAYHVRPRLRKAGIPFEASGIEKEHWPAAYAVLDKDALFTKIDVKFDVPQVDAEIVPDRQIGNGLTVTEPRKPILAIETPDLKMVCFEPSRGLSEATQNLHHQLIDIVQQAAISISSKGEAQGTNDANEGLHIAAQLKTAYIEGVVRGYGAVTEQSHEEPKDYQS